MGVGGGGGAVTVVGASGAGLPAVVVGAADVVVGAPDALDGGGGDVGLGAGGGVDVVVRAEAGTQIGRTEDWASSLS